MEEAARSKNVAVLKAERASKEEARKARKELLDETVSRLIQEAWEEADKILEEEKYKIAHAKQAIDEEKERQRLESAKIVAAMMAPKETKPQTLAVTEEAKDEH